MRHSLPLVQLAFLLLATPADAQSTATLPLDELLRLRDRARPEEAEPDGPPLAAAITEAAFSGRLIDRGLDLTGAFKVAVLEEGWVRVPLLRVGPDIHLKSITAPDGDTVAVEGDRLVLLTSKPGTHAVQVGLLSQARVDGSARRAGLTVEKASVAVLRIRFDPDLFQLAGQARALDGDERVFYPDHGTFQVAWRMRSPPAAIAKGQGVRPPVETVITSAHASVVCTLDGLQLARIAYQVRLHGTQSIRFGIPAGSAVKRVFLNGAPVPFSLAAGSTLAVEATAGRAGDETARIELVLQGERREFHLAGRLAFAFPSASCGQNALSVSLHLPAVFDYAWSGGSLAPGGEGPEPDYAYELPTPGKALRFRQELPSASPDLAVSYRVELENQYFRGANDAS
jgi:hypothetical protein